MHLLRTPPRLTIALVATVAALTFTGAALATLFGANALRQGSCCSGQALNGTRAYISASSNSPDASNCTAFASAVTSFDSNRQLQAGIVRCGSSANVDGTCSLSNNLVKYVERIPATGSPVCYPHGAASLNTSYLLTVDDSANSGTWQAYIDGVLQEGQSGYTSSVGIEEWGEYTGTGCSGWSAAASISTWQRYNYSLNSWITVQSASLRNDGCWSVGSVSSGNFSVSH